MVDDLSLNQPFDNRLVGYMVLGLRQVSLMVMFKLEFGSFQLSKFFDNNGFVS